MKPYYIFAVLWAAGCQPKLQIEYNIPENIPEANRIELMRILNEGKTNYKIHCSSCHGIFSSGKEHIPNFTKVQLDNYTTKNITDDTENHGNARKMSQQELKSVLIFLNLIKRQGQQ